jgi:uncharacterized protein (TIGR00369 family)
MLTPDKDRPNLPLADDPPASRILGRRLIGELVPGEFAIAYVAQPEFTNRHGTVQGGFLSAMLDSATAYTLLLALPPDKTAVTTRLDTTFVSPAHPGPLVAFACIEARDERQATVAAVLKNAEGIIVARATAELRIVARRPTPTASGAAPKGHGESQ